jgi:hypothetical protein
MTTSQRTVKLFREFWGTQYVTLINIYVNKRIKFYSVETTYGINSVISKLMTFVENAETGQFLFLIALILSWFTYS